MIRLVLVASLLVSAPAIAQSEEGVSLELAVKSERAVEMELSIFLRSLEVPVLHRPDRTDAIPGYSFDAYRPETWGRREVVRTETRFPFVLPPRRVPVRPHWLTTLYLRKPRR